MKAYVPSRAEISIESKKLFYQDFDELNDDVLNERETAEAFYHIVIRMLSWQQVKSLLFICKPGLENFFVRDRLKLVLSSTWFLCLGHQTGYQNLDSK